MTVDDEPEPLSMEAEADGSISAVAASSAAAVSAAAVSAQASEDFRDDFF